MLVVQLDGPWTAKHRRPLHQWWLTRPSRPALEVSDGDQGRESVRRRRDTEPTTPWLIGIARHKLADHWRRAQRTPEPVDDLPDHGDDPWDTELDRMVAHHTLGQLSPIHRSVLTLRYVDDLPVGECAESGSGSFKEARKTSEWWPSPILFSRVM